MQNHGTGGKSAPFFQLREFFAVNGYSPLYLVPARFLAHLFLLRSRNLRGV
jgi:hypothetical protein